MGDRRKDGSGSDDEAGVTRKDMGKGEGYEASGGVHRMIAPHPQKRLELQRVAAASMAPRTVVPEPWTSTSSSYVPMT